jgi:molybdopterin/thiamine biosynthesis adenylyltransferase
MKKSELISRFADADFVTEDSLDIILIGAGGIGSYLGFFLSRLQHNLYIYDGDEYAIENMAGQLTRLSDLGKNKAEALKQLLSDFSGNQSIETYGWFEDDSMVGDIVFTGLDNMKTRKLAFEKWYNLYLEKVEANEDTSMMIFFDGRLALENFEIYVVEPHNAEEYRKSLFDDSEVEEPICSLKQTSHAAGMIATKMVAFFTNWLANKLSGEEVRVCPFYYEEIIPINYVNSREVSAKQEV